MSSTVSPDGAFMAASVTDGDAALVIVGLKSSKVVQRIGTNAADELRTSAATWARKGPERVDQLAGRRRRRERPCGFDRALYRRRNVVERCFHRLKQWRGIATRYDKQPGRYLAAITLASTLIWLET
ncbi:transposase [Streptomyces spiralis]